MLAWELLKDKDMYLDVNRRFSYGKLCWGQLNKTYRLTQSKTVRDYKTGYKM
jgi:hypothetical protein